MKRVAAIVFAAFITLGLTGSAFAKSAGSSSSHDVEMDASLVVASAPTSGFDDTLGVTFGAGMMLPQINKDLQGRIEISYLQWTATEFGIDVSYTRVPIDAGARFFLPAGNEKLKVFVQGMLELSFDRAEAGTLPGNRVSESDVNLGLVPGAGIEYKMDRNLSLVADARLHIITDSYATVQVGVAYHF